MVSWWKIASMYRSCTSYADRSACVADLAEACLSLKKQLGYSDPDARSVALNNVASIARAGQMTLNLLDSWVKGDELIRTVIPQLLGLTTVTPEAVKLAGDYLNKSAKLALAVLAQFQIENAFRNIHRELALGVPGTGFYRCAKAVLDFLSLPSIDMETLNTPARIRNSLHANGIHHRQHPAENPVVVIKGVRYEFHDGRKVKCASWEHIAHALECSVGVLEGVFRHSRVRQVPDPMMDQYAWEELTEPPAAA